MNRVAGTENAFDSLRNVKDDRHFVLLDLHSHHRERRRHALRTARSRHWIDSYGDVRVRALLVDAIENGSLEEFERALTLNGRDHTVVLMDVGGYILVTSERRADVPIEEWVHSLTPPGVQVTAIGSAALRSEEDDLMRAIDEARTTAEIVLQLGDTLPSNRAEDLGAWRLLHAIGGDPELIISASPAANELWRSDPMRRLTVETYLDSGCNVASACSTLHIHRTTLYYRLESMPEIVREALGDGLKRSTLHLALKLLRLWNGAAVPAAAAPAESRRESPAVLGRAAV
ncbi:Regulator of polyketide synthase expression [Cryobacterium arcticum]|uniref:Regulator of polyketide synthase expression n=2 Tax=Cryobacterium arcticum TaxID=670052 RepID=A0A1B1BI63_9MICO|nr:Regulator of polyketide synthase expression [Cryobacterium arcticum]